MLADLQFPLCKKENQALFVFLDISIFLSPLQNEFSHSLVVGQGNWFCIIFMV